VAASGAEDVGGQGPRPAPSRRRRQRAATRLARRPLDRSNGERGAHDGHVITIGGVTYAKGIGAHAPSEIVYYTGAQCATVSSDYGIDDEKSGNGDATWQIWADGTLAAQGSATWRDGPKHLDADVTGARFVRLVTLDNGSTNSDHTDWAAAQIGCD